MEFPSCPMLLSSFLMSSVVYWNAYFVVDYLIWKYAQDVYYRLEEDELRKLCPLILMILRAAFGLFFTLPSCVLAATTTPWGVNQPLNSFGQLCVVSQAAGWANELSLIRFYSFELFVHHIICLLVTSNIILSPAVHQIKPLYIYFASLVGDVGPVAVSILRLLGYRLKTSKHMWWISFASTMILIFCRIGCAFYTLTQVLTDPYNLTDWVWVLSVLLFGTYSIFNAIRNLQRLELIKVDPNRYRVKYFSKLDVPIANMFLALACSASLLSTLFMYGIYLDRPLRMGETHLISLHGLIAVAIGLTGALLLIMTRTGNCHLQDPWGALYVPFGVLITGHWAKFITRYTTFIDRDTLLGSMGISVPLFFAFSRVAQYYTVKDAAVASNEKRPVDGGYNRLHLESVIEHITIFFMSLSFSAFNDMDPSETARLAICASLIVQLRNPREDPLAFVTPPETIPSLASLAKLPGPKLVIILITAWYVGNRSTSIDAMQARVALGFVVLMAICISKPLMASKPCEGISAPRKSKRYHPITILYVFFGTLQAILVWKYATFEGGKTETSLGFKNFRSVLSDPFTWVGLLHMASLPIVVLRGAE
ncbi:unnamed protein product [Fusarium graminearum]|uniref:Uncharacterized protein n=1 Tax=Gibberella zeae TaxID=5518 RepID=A0A2H3FHM0_GIBZA|nr:hypothetical protein FGRA07_07158 [Fusarium graminearum]CAF3630474.1 unnamed protein product [Fusarium graminearum]CAG1971488.1 unnamed protein product [Fusarium graminearum]CAG1973840.1 unnamed protein product [Fusarium graminearum]CAG1984884.1 unnamed protein product [Fusarium graminearum]